MLNSIGGARTRTSKYVLIMNGIYIFRFWDIRVEICLELMWQEYKLGCLECKVSWKIDGNHHGRLSRKAFQLP